MTAAPPSADLQEEVGPCPFCGKSDTYFERGGFSWGFIQCNECGARGPSAEQTGDDEEWPGKANASAAWNRRATPPPPAGSREAEPKPPNESGSTQCIVRWMVETEAGWLGAWDKEAFAAYAKAAGSRPEDAGLLKELHSFLLEVPLLNIKDEHRAKSFADRIEALTGNKERS